MEKINIYLTSGTYSNNTFNMINDGDTRFISIKDHYEWLKNKVRSFVELEDNWDGYEAGPTLPEVAENAEILINCLNADFIERVFDVYPNPHGTMSIEWQNDNGEKLSLEIGKTKYSYFVKYNNKNPKLVDGQSMKYNVKCIIAELRDLFMGQIARIIL